MAVCPFRLTGHHGDVSADDQVAHPGTAGVTMMSVACLGHRCALWRSVDMGGGEVVEECALAAGADMASSLRQQLASVAGALASVDFSLDAIARRP